jgi:hypothetical protein
MAEAFPGIPPEAPKLEIACVTAATTVADADRSMVAIAGAYYLGIATILRLRATT